MKIISIIPAPPESWVVVGPCDHLTYGCEYEPCSCLAVVEGDDGVQKIVPLGYDDNLDVELMAPTASLFRTMTAADREYDRRRKKFDKMEEKSSTEKGE